MCTLESAFVPEGLVKSLTSTDKASRALIRFFFFICLFPLHLVESVHTRRYRSAFENLAVFTAWPRCLASSDSGKTLSLTSDCDRLPENSEDQLGRDERPCHSCNVRFRLGLTGRIERTCRNGASSAFLRQVKRDDERQTRDDVGVRIIRDRSMNTDPKQTNKKTKIQKEKRENLTKANAYTAPQCRNDVNVWR